MDLLSTIPPILARLDKDTWYQYIVIPYLSSRDLILLYSTGNGQMQDWLDCKQYQVLLSKKTPLRARHPRIGILPQCLGTVGLRIMYALPLAERPKYEARLAQLGPYHLNVEISRYSINTMLQLFSTSKLKTLTIKPIDTCNKRYIKPVDESVIKSLSSVTDLKIVNSVRLFDDADIQTFVKHMPQLETLELSWLTLRTPQLFFGSSLTNLSIKQVTFDKLPQFRFPKSLTRLKLNLFASSYDEKTFETTMFPSQLETLSLCLRIVQAMPTKNLPVIPASVTKLSMNALSVHYLDTSKVMARASNLQTFTIKGAISLDSIQLQNVLDKIPDSCKRVRVVDVTRIPIPTSTLTLWSCIPKGLTIYNMLSFEVSQLDNRTHHIKIHLLGQPKASHLHTLLEQFGQNSVLKLIVCLKKGDKTSSIGSLERHKKMGWFYYQLTNGDSFIYYRGKLLVENSATSQVLST